MAKKYLRKTEKLAEIEIEYASVENLIKCLRSIQEDFSSKGYDNMYIEIEETTVYYYGDIERTYVIYGVRTETEKERNKRLENARKARENRKTQKEKKIGEDRKLFESFKKKYGW